MSTKHLVKKKVSTNNRTRFSKTESERTNQSILPTLTNRKKHQNSKNVSFFDLSKAKALPKIKTVCERFDDMLEGCMDDLLPKPPTEVRVFLSSTFMDMRAERNRLQRDVYPRIRKYCLDKFHLDFRVVDMRWGITDDATNEHITEQLCLAEIANCQRVSLGPNFVMMLGNRYGFRPLPTQLEATEFSLLLEQAKKLSIPDTYLLSQWYLLDSNAVPPVYVLQPINSLIENFGNHGAGKAGYEKAKSEWWRVSKTLQCILRSAATQLYSEGLMTKSRKHDFYKSVTEFEINAGLIQATEPNEHTMCFVRQFTDLEKVNEKELAQYTDITILENGTHIIDEEAAHFREKVQCDTIPRFLHKSNIFRYSAPWTEQQPTRNEPSDSQATTYLDQLCSDFESTILDQIARAHKARDIVIPKSEYYSDLDETLHHLHFAKTKMANFRGQEVTLELIRKYLTSSPIGFRTPLVLFAESGAGKTSIMAAVAANIPTWLGTDSLCILRFLGTSTYSGSIYNVLRSVAGQIADCFDMIMEPVGYKTMRALVRYLPRFLRTVARSTKQNIVVLLDSLDQLSPDDGAHALRWLPTELPRNVHIIVSTLPRLHDILSNARRLIPRANAFLEIPPLSMENSFEIINAYLTEKKRTLTPAQQELISGHPNNAQSPLYLRLVVDTAATWRSYTPTESLSVAPSIKAAIELRFRRLEQKFGEIFISAVFGYLTIGVDGLTEIELEDTLSLDDDVLNEVYQYHDPPVEGIVRIPTLLWARVRYDIGEYLTERKSHGKMTIFWYHRQFIEMARERYVSPGVANRLHSHLASLYLVTDGVYRDIILQHRHMTIPSADRQVTPQVLSAQNHRLLAALPHHLNCSGDITAAKTSALCNLDFMLAKAKGMGVAALLKDYDAFCHLDPVVQSVREAISRSSGHTMAAELLTRLRCHDDIHILKLLKQAHSVVEVAPVYAFLSDENNVTSETNSMEIKPLFVLPNCEQLVETSLDGKHAIVRQTSNDVVVDCINERTILMTRGVRCISKDSVFALNALWGYSISRMMIETYDMTKHSVGKTFEIELPALLESSDPVVDMFTVSCDNCYLVIAYNSRIIELWSVMQETCTARYTLSQKLHEPHIENILISLATNNIVVLVSCRDDNGSETAVTNIYSTHDTRSVNFTVSGRVLADGACLWPNNTLLFPVMTDSTKLTMHFVDVNKDGCLTEQPIIVCHKSDVVGVTSSTLGQKNYVCIALKEVVKVCEIRSEKSNRMEEINLFSLQCDGCDVITSVFIENDADYLYVGTESGIMAIWHLLDWRLVSKVKIHEGIIKKILLTNYDERVITFGKSIDNSSAYELKIWNQKSLLPMDQDSRSHDSKDRTDDTQVATLPRHQSAISIAFTADSKSLYSIDNDGNLSTWDISSLVRSKSLAVGSANQMFLTSDGTKAVILMDMDGCSIKVIQFSPIEAVTIVKDLDGVILAGTMTLDDKYLYVIAKSADSKFTIYQVELSSDEPAIVRSIPIKNTVMTDDIEMKLTENNKFLVLRVRCSEKEHEIILKSECRGNMTPSSGCYKFVAVRLHSQSGDLLICNRMLTQLPMLGNTAWAALADSQILIGRDRVTVIWDIEAENCSDRIYKNTKLPMFYRPEWIEDDVRTKNGKICWGRTLCTERAARRADAQTDVTVIGSEDGWVVTYDSLNGMSLNEDLGKKASHDSPVHKVAVSKDGRWIASVSTDTTLKVWTAKLREMLSLTLHVHVTQMTFCNDGRYLGIVGRRCSDDTKSAVLLFEITPLATERNVIPI